VLSGPGTRFADGQVADSRGGGGLVDIEVRLARTVPPAQGDKGEMSRESGNGFLNPLRVFDCGDGRANVCGCPGSESGSGSGRFGECSLPCPSPWGGRTGPGAGPEGGDRRVPET